MSKIPVPGSSLDRELEACAKDPVYFAIRHCWTVDPWDDGRAKLIPPWPFVATYLDSFASRGNKLFPKSRKMLLSWLAPAGFLWKASFRRRFSGIMASRKQSLVDDGGEGSTQDSLFGRYRLMWEALDPGIRSRIPARFALCRITHPASGSSIRGEATSPNVGRAGAYDDALLDEAAFIPQSEDVHRALHLACPDGKTYQSTPDGPLGAFPRLCREVPHGYLLIPFHWTLHPERWDGKELDAETGKPTSQWYRDTCAGMLPDQIARELEISFEHSVEGLIYPEFSREKHVRSEVAYDPDLPLRLWIDPGIGAPTAALFVQTYGEQVRILRDYEKVGGTVEEHVRAFLAIARSLGHSGEPGEILVAMDPAANAREAVKGNRVLREYQHFGFVRITTPRVKQNDGIRLCRRKFYNDETLVSPECDLFPLRAAGYRFRGPDTDEPEHDICSHMMDALRYGETACYRVDEPAVPRAPRPSESRPLVYVGAMDPDIAALRAGTSRDSETGGTLFDPRLTRGM